MDTTRAVATRFQCLEALCKLSNVFAIVETENGRISTHAGDENTKHRQMSQKNATN